MASRGPSAPRRTSRAASRPAPTRRASRPAKRASAAAASARTPNGAPRRDQGNGLWRWGVIALVALVLLVLLAPTVRSYFAQRGEIAALERDVAAGVERVAELEAEQDRWRDPAYVEQQARERLKFVRPGDVSYTVIGADEIESQQVATGQVAETRPWYDRMWASIGQADRADVAPTP